MKTECEKCGCGMELVDQPRERTLFTVFGREFIIRHYEKLWYCFECPEIRRQQRESDIYREAGQEGYDKGYEDGRRAEQEGKKRI